MPYIKQGDFLKLLRAGNGLSNAAYNLKQMNQWLPDHIRESLYKGQKEWDEIKRKVVEGE